MTVGQVHIDPEAALDRVQRRFEGVPIIVLTSVGNPGGARQCKEIGIDRFLTKPVRQVELYKVMESVLREPEDAARE